MKTKGNVMAKVFYGTQCDPSIMRHLQPGLRGFTLVELLVVISIIGLLAGLGIPAINRGLESARTAGCANNLKQMGFAVQRFSAEHDGYLIKSWFNQGPDFPTGGNDWEYLPADWAGWDRVVLDYLEQGTLGPNGKRVYTEKSASICRCPADKTKGNVFSNYLVGVGAIPNSYRFNDSMQRVGQEKAVRMVSIPSPSKLILVVDGVWKSYHHVRTDDAVDIGKISPSNTNNVATTRHGGAANYLFADGHVERLKWEDTWNKSAPGADPAWGLWRQ
jgi:general secretion pathway protein G